MRTLTLATYKSWPVRKYCDYVLSEAEISSIVSAGGGRYVGIVNAIPEKLESIILFVSPQTRTTLGIPISRLTVEAVRERLAESDAAFTEVDPK